MKWNSNSWFHRLHFCFELTCPVLPHEPDSCPSEYLHLVDLKVLRGHQHLRTPLPAAPGKGLVDALVDRGQVGAQPVDPLVHASAIQPRQA